MEVIVIVVSVVNRTIISLVREQRGSRTSSAMACHRRHECT